MLALPFAWSKPRMVFVNSMGDLFHEDVPLEFILQVFDVMLATPCHTYQLLTKRDIQPARRKERQCSIQISSKSMKPGSRSS
jgi:protein gp37